MAARGDHVRDNVQGLMDDLTCPVPWCQAAVCSEAARYVIAARDEVPSGCANGSPLGRSPDRLRRALGSAECRLTAGARSLLALRPGGASAQSILTQLEEGRLVFLEPRTPRPLRSTALARRRPLTPPISAVPAAGADDKVAWIKLRVVDDLSGEPLPGVVLRVTQPNGKAFEHTTRADGAVEVHGIDPGTCSVACGLEHARLVDTYAFVTLGEQPSSSALTTSRSRVSTQRVRIANVEEHKVRAGESIKSLAEANGLSWQELARFNWDTDVPDEINQKLRDEVGCTQKAPDGVNYRFDDSDEPGIVFIPRAWQLAGLATEQEHTFRVRSLGYTTGHWVEVRIIDEAAKPIEGLAVTLIRADGSRKPGMTDAKGVARWAHLPNEKVRVTIDDKEYALEPESDVEEAGVPAAVAVAETEAAGPSGRAYDGHELDPHNERRLRPEEVD